MLKKTACALIVAIAALTAACSEDPEVAKREFVESGDAYIEQGQYAEAIIEYRNAVQVDPLFGEARLKLAEAYAHEDRIEDAFGEYSVTAEERFRAAIQADPNQLGAYSALGRLYVSQNRTDSAIAQFDEMARREANPAGSHTVIGILLESQGQASEAMARYEQALQADPEAAVAGNNLAWLLAEQGTNLDRALDLARTAKSVLPESPVVSDTLGWVLHKRGLSSLAIAPLTEAVEMDQGNASYHYHLGVVQAAAGNPEEARAALNRALTFTLAASDEAAARELLATLQP